MLSKEKAMYQTWLIIEGLSNEERSLIDEELLEEIQNTMEVDERIKIDFSIPLEKQKLDDKTWKMLDKVMKSAEKNGYQKVKKQNKDLKEVSLGTKENESVEKIKLENIQLTKELQKMREESKSLLTDYKEAFEKAQEENKKLKTNCEELIQILNQIPAFIRKIFVKDEKIKMLKGEL